MTENILIYQENLTLLDLPENSLFMIPVSIMTKIPMKRTDDPSIHMKQILRPFSSSQVKKDWIFKHTSSGVVTIGGKVTLWQNCKLRLRLYQLWSYSIIRSALFFARKFTIFNILTSNVYYWSSLDIMNDFQPIFKMAFIHFCEIKQIKQSLFSLFSKICIVFLCF